jgi:hypothetical protein
MPTECGRIHLGPLVEGAYLCRACGRVMTRAEALTYRRIRVQVTIIIREAHEFLADYLKKRA